MQNKYTKSMQAKHYAKIPAKISARGIMARLGAKHMDNKLQSQVEQAIPMLVVSGICLPAVADVVEGAAHIEGREFRSEKLAAYMRGCDMALVMAATAGQNTADKIEYLMNNGSADMAVVLDAAAAVAVDSALDFMTGAWARGNARLGMRPLKRRFSPGYGDLALSSQLEIFNMLDAGTLGIGITESYMLQPDKSVFAICGVERCG